MSASKPSVAYNILCMNDFRLMCWTCVCEDEEIAQRDRVLEAEKRSLHKALSAVSFFRQRNREENFHVLCRPDLPGGLSDD
jgi:hypothetical protein